MDLSDAFIFGVTSGLFLALILFCMIWLLQRQVARRTVRQVMDEIFQDERGPYGAPAPASADEEEEEEEAELSPTRRYLPRV